MNSSLDIGGYEKQNLNRYYNSLIEDNGRIEVRIRRHDFNSHIWVGNRADLYAAFRKYRGFTVQHSINRPKPDAVGFLNIQQIESVTRLFFDLDPQRDKGQKSSSDQLNFAIRMARTLQTILEEIGWPEPATAHSGNGIHLHYRLKLPYTKEIKEKIGRLYQGIEKYLGSMCLPVTFDTNTRHASTTCRTYGLPNRKHGCNLKTSIQVPENFLFVSETMFEKALANPLLHIAAPKPPRPRPKAKTRQGQADYNNLDMVGLFQGHELYIKPMSDRKHAVLCPWHQEHSGNNTGDCVVWESAGTGWPQWHCSHASCSHRKVLDVLEWFGRSTLEGYCHGA